MPAGFLSRLKALYLYPLGTLCGHAPWQLVWKSRIVGKHASSLLANLARRRCYDEPAYFLRPESAPVVSPRERHRHLWVHFLSQAMNQMSWVLALASERRDSFGLLLLPCDT